MSDSFLAAAVPHGGQPFCFSQNELIRGVSDHFDAVDGASHQSLLTLHEL